MVYKKVRKVVIGVIGGTVVLLGVVMLVTPGPGLAAIVGGLAILASEFVFAAVLLRRIKSQARGMAERVGLAKKHVATDAGQPSERDAAGALRRSDCDSGGGQG